MARENSAPGITAPKRVAVAHPFADSLILPEGLMNRPGGRSDPLPLVWKVVPATGGQGSLFMA